MWLGDEYVSARVHARTLTHVLLYTECDTEKGAVLHLLFTKHPLAQQGPPHVIIRKHLSKQRAVRQTGSNHRP